MDFPRAPRRPRTSRHPHHCEPRGGTKTEGGIHTDRNPTPRTEADTTTPAKHCTGGGLECTRGLDRRERRKRRGPPVKCENKEGVPRRPAGQRTKLGRHGGSSTLLGRVVASADDRRTISEPTPGVGTPPKRGPAPAAVFGQKAGLARRRRPLLVTPWCS